jgi:hypothetical protein
MATTCFGPLVGINRYTVQKLKEGVKKGGGLSLYTFSFCTVYLKMAPSGPKHVVAIL